MDVETILGRYGYYIIFLLTVVVYQLGFSRKLPILKAVIVYVVIALGCVPLTILAAQLPIVEALLITIVFLIIVHVRRRQSKNASGSEREE